VTKIQKITDILTIISVVQRQKQAIGLKLRGDPSLEGDFIASLQVGV
jgi:hypothetical protein